MELSDYYRKHGLSRIVVIAHERKISMTGVENENVYQTVVAAHGDGFVRVLVHLLIQFMPSREEFTVLSENEITQSEYHRLAQKTVYED
jgi:hypothetical protein